jgi:hypothetical protein
MIILVPDINSLNISQCINFVDSATDHIIHVTVSDHPYLRADCDSIDYITKKQNVLRVIPVNQDNIDNFYNMLIAKYNYDIILPTWSDVTMHIFAKYSTVCKPLPSFSKTELNSIAKKFSITTPENIENYNNFPILAKPDRGTGGYGVKKLHNKEEFYNFFNGDHIKSSPYQVLIKGKVMHPDYHNFGGDYLLQEFIDGDVISVVGHVLAGKIYFSFHYDIMQEEIGYFITTSSCFPSIHAIPDIRSRLIAFINHLEIDNVPFVFDFILKDDDLYMIDFSSRFISNFLIYEIFPQWYTEFLNSVIAGENLMNFDYAGNVHLSMLTDKTELKEYKQQDIVKILQPTRNIKTIRHIKDVQSRGYIILKR